MSEQERFGIEGQYYLVATGELEKAAQSGELFQQIYPRDAEPYHALAFICASLGNWEKFLEESRGGRYPWTQMRGLTMPTSASPT